MLRRLLVVSVLALGLPATAALAGVSSRPSPPAPYSPPPFAKACHFRHFGEAQKPPVAGYKDDPLCVDYAKRDITVDNGGAVRFALAEPARFAIAASKCKDWQTDHWSIQVDRGFTALARWDGSYWFDKGKGIGGVLLRNFRVGGQPVGADQMAAFVATVSPAMAEQIERYGAGAHGSGGGMSFSLGNGYPQCPTASPPARRSPFPADACFSSPQPHSPRGRSRRGSTGSRRS